MLRDDHYRLIRETIEPEARNQRVGFRQYTDSRGEPR